MMRYCIYCNKEKNGTEFSLEHIFPVALGGQYLDSNLFQTNNVCKECNNKFGLYIDGPFLKNYFIKNESFNHYFDYIDNIQIRNKIYEIPFVYLGTIVEPQISHPNFNYCDYWVWAGGNRVYHFHNNYINEFFQSFVSGHPIKFKSRKEAGEAYLVGALNGIDERFFIIMLQSFKKQFKYQKRFSVNINIEYTDEKTSNFFEEPNNTQQEIIFKIQRTANQKIHARVVLWEGYEWKFLAKVAIGLGFNLFGSKFLKSEDFKTFQKILTINDNNEIKKILIRSPVMTNSLNSNPLKDFGKIIASISGHTLLFLKINTALFFVVWLYNEKYPYMVKITDDITQFEKNSLLNKFNNGFIYLCVPALQESIGPIDFPAYIAYLLGDDKFLHDIEKLFLQRVKICKGLIE